MLCAEKTRRVHLSGLPDVHGGTSGFANQNAFSLFFPSLIDSFVCVCVVPYFNKETQNYGEGIY